jgi:hypothetical protein
MKALVAASISSANAANAIKVMRELKILVLRARETLGFGDFIYDFSFCTGRLKTITIGTTGWGHGTGVRLELDTGEDCPAKKTGSGEKATACVIVKVTINRRRISFL